MSKILVTGGTGFIGSFLVSELEKDGHEVMVLTNDRNTEISDGIIFADITDRKAILDIIQDFDMVYHLAGLLGTSELIEKAYEASMVNIIGTVNILDGARKNNTKVIEITKPNVWNNTYSITKSAGESFTKMYHDEFGLPTVSIKWFNVYGPNQSFHCQKAVPFFTRWALEDHDIGIWGDGEQTVDLIHAKDAVRATILVAGEKSLEGTTIEIGSGEETTVNKLADMIVAEADSKSKIVHYSMRAGETNNTRLCADTTTLDKLGFKPEYTLLDGIKETVAWYRENL